MQKVVNNFHVLMLLVLLPLNLLGSITAAEYYFNNSDAGPGSNIALSITTSDTTASLSESVSTASLADGMHMVYVRFQDDVRGWGPARGRPFLVAQTESATEISGAETYIDLDAGPGSNTAASITTNGGVTSLSTVLNFNDLSVGIHVAYVRFFDETAGWGPARGRLFVVPPDPVSNAISAAEYFFDANDLGAGANSALTLGSPGSVVSLSEVLNLPELGGGLHAVSVRFYGTVSGWGPPRSQLFLVDDPNDILFIQSAQYYIGSPDNMVTVTTPTDGNFDEAQEAFSLTDITVPDGLTGRQKVGVRFQRSDDSWGPWRSQTFQILDETEVSFIQAAEYFIDVDPGPGLATSVELPEDGVFDEAEEEFNFPVAIEGLDEGHHTAYLRLQTSNGTWGLARGKPFIVSEDAQPTIAAAEYFINPATAEGSGIAFSPLDGAFNTTEESVSALANMASLGAQTVGNYTLYARFMNSRGEWGPTSSRTFMVETRPQISTSTDTLDFAAVFTGETRELSFTISNIGDEELGVSALNFSDPAYTSDWNSGTILPLGSETFIITFAPVDPAANHLGILTIANNDFDKAITLLGRGLDTAPIMAVLPDSLNFGTVQTIAIATLSVRVSNSGNEDLLLSGITSTNTAFSASIANPTVVPDEYVDVDITFSPSLGETYTDTVYLISNDTYFPSYPIYVTGMGSIVPVPDIRLSASVINFGNIELSTAPVQMILNIQNGGTAILNISSISIDESVFSSSLSGAQTVGIGASLPITISFTPTQSGRYSGELIISNDDPDSPEIIVSLDGSSVFPEMVLGANTFTFGEVGVTTSSAQSLIISNLGSDTLKISAFVPSATIDTILSISPPTFNVNPNGGQKAFSLNFHPAEPVEYQGIVVIVSNDNNDTLYISGTGLDNEAPEIVFDPEALENVGTTENTAILITAPITDNNQLSWVRLYFRQGGKTEYDSTTMELEPSGYQGEIPAAYVRNRGVEYYIKAFDGANARVIPETAPVVPAIIRVRLPSLPPFTFVAERYGMISVPSDLDQKNVLLNLESDMGDYDVNAWRLFRWINGNYVELSENENFTFDPGNAYWLITSEREVITMDSSTSVKTNEEYLISLDQGWNQVGTPYYFPVSWNDVYVATPGVVQGSIAYEWVDDDWAPASVMQPFGGYFTSTSSGGNILRFPPKEAIAGTAKKATIPFNLTENEWLLNFSAENSHSRDLYNYIGVLNDAETGLDIRDQPKPPAMYADRVQLFSEHGEWGATGSRFSGDFQAASGEGNFWDLTLLTGAVEDDILLSLNRLGELPSSFDIRVLNLDLRYELNEHHNGEYIQRHFANQERYRLRVMAGTSDFLAKHDEGITQAPEQFRLAQNYPNPFNGETRIQFDIPEPTGLRIVIYDMTGREVVELLRSDAHAVGYHEISWSGNNSSGHRVASGIYLISFQSDSFRATRKMVLLK